LSDPNTDRPKPSEAELDRLLYRGKRTPSGRKAMSGSEFAGVGLQFSMTIVVFALAGVWLDKRLGTSPWLVILMVFSGAGLGFWSMYRKMIRPGKEGR
jgi:F0F1-type ATP synthase assembly protein I